MKMKCFSPAYIVVLAVAIALFAAALTIRPLSELTVTSDAAFPIIVSGIGIILAVSIVAGDIKSKKKDGGEAESGDDTKVLDRDVVVLIALMALYGVLLFLIGYILSTLVFTVLAIGYLHESDWKTGLLVGFISTFMIVLVFKYGFSVILP